MVEDLSTLKIGESPNILVMIKSIQSVESANGVYQKYIVRDKHDHEEVVFNFGGLKGPEIAPQVVKMGVAVKDYRGEPSIQFVNYMPVENGKLEAFLPEAKVDYKKAWAELVKPIVTIRSELKEIVQHVLATNQMAFLGKALTSNRGFSRKSGILEATLKLEKLAISTSDTLELDKDLMIAGAALYFIGHVDTMDGAFNLTEDDALLGSSVVAQNKVAMSVMALKNHENANEEALNRDMKLLSHILLSRMRGMQSVIPEAVALKDLASIVMQCDFMKN